MKHASLFVMLVSTCLSACGSSSTIDPSSGGPVDSATAPDLGGSDALPSSWVECTKQPCRVSLDAFKHASGIPHCPTLWPGQESLRTEYCHADTIVENVRTGNCGAFYIFEIIYGFPGDNYRCAYDSTDALVGAEWSPDNHPQQQAGTIPACTLPDRPCASSDGGVQGDERG